MSVPDPTEHVAVPDSATPAEAQIIATLAVVRVQLGQALGALGDHEERIRALEARRHVSPGMLWSALGGFVALVAAAATVIMAIEGAFR